MQFVLGVGWGFVVALLTWCVRTAPQTDELDADAIPETRQGVASRLWDRTLGWAFRYAARQWGKL